jgi:hypothetical protein
MKWPTRLDSKASFSITTTREGNTRVKCHKTTRDRRWLAYVAIVWAGNIGGIAAADPEDPLRIELVGSIDNEMCRPLAQLYDRLNHAHHKVLDWEDHFRKEFQAIGFERPQPLKDPQHPLIREGEQIRGFYSLDLAGDGQNRFVYLQDIPVGAHGAFGTNIWIIRKNAAVDPERANEASRDISLYFPTISDFATSFTFNFRRLDIPHVGAPYFFEDLDGWSGYSGRERSFLTDLGFPRGSVVVQRIFQFERQIIVTARDMGNETVLVYKIGDQQTTKAICYMANASLVASMKANRRK